MSAASASTPISGRWLGEMRPGRRVLVCWCTLGGPTGTSDEATALRTNWGHALLEELPNEIPNLRSALRVLSALIAPAILILACSALVQLASALLTNMIERTRHIAAVVRELGDSQDELELLVEDLARATRRSRMLQRALSSLLFAIVMLVLSSVFFGIVAVWLPRSAWAPILLTVIGVGFLLYACVILALDSWVGVKAVDMEMGLIRRAHNVGAKPRTRSPSSERCSQPTPTPASACRPMPRRRLHRMPAAVRSCPHATEDSREAVTWALGIGPPASYGFWIEDGGVTTCRGFWRPVAARLPGWLRRAPRKVRRASGRRSRSTA